MKRQNNHPDKVVGYEGSLEQLARAVGNMTYDQVAEFLEKLSQDFERQAEADFKRGRKKLSSQLVEASANIYRSKKNIDSAWRISKPHM